MRTGQTIARLTEFAGRGPGSDAERRAALWLAGQLREAGLQPRVQTFWCRPNWALAHAWHAALALAGSLVAVADARVGLGLVLVALASLLADAWRGVSLGRLLTPQRASQNVIVASPASEATGAARRRLLVTANYDAGRTGVAYGPAATAVRRALRRATAGRLPGWLAWLAIAMAWVAVTAILRIHGTPAATAGPLAVVPSAALVLALALLLEAGAAAPGPGAGDNATGTAVALSLLTALRASPPRHLDIELVLCGAHEGGAIGLRRHLRAQRASRASRAGRAGRGDRPSQPGTVVLGLGACGHGAPVWWLSDGTLLAHRTPAALRAAASQTSALPHRGRGASPAYAAYARRLPAISLGAVDSDGLVPCSHRPDDLPEALDPRASDRVLELALSLIDALDACVAPAAAGRAVRTG